MSYTTDEILDKIAHRTFGPSDAEFEERRRHARFAFPAIQLVAPYGGGQIPAAASFQTVKCHDLSCGGLSYYLEQPPIVHDIAIALSIRGEVKYLSAHIVRTIAMLTEEGLKFLVGCKFVGRLDASS